MTEKFIVVLLNLKIETLEPNLKKYSIKAKLGRAEALQLCSGVLAYFLQGLGVNPQHCGQIKKQNC